MRSFTELVLIAYGTGIRHRGQDRVHTSLRRLLGPFPQGERKVTRGGLEWYLDPCDVAHRDLYWLGEYDRWDSHHFRRLARPGATVIDIGANFGYYAVTTAVALKRVCRLYAFEPFPETFDLLRRHVEANGLTDVIVPQPFAVSDVSGRATIHGWAGTEVNSGAATLGSPTDGCSTSGVDVEVVAIDDWVGRNGIARVDVMKVDAEGFEERVFLGASRVLRRDAPTLMFELHTRMLRRAGTTPERVVDLVHELGYRCFVARRERLVPLSGLPADGDYFNVFAFPEPPRPRSRNPMVLE